MDMSERIKKGIWPHPALKLSDLIKVIAEYLKSNRTFPHEWIERKNGELIDDVSVIERKGGGVFVYRSRRANPTNLRRLGKKMEKIFNTVDSAAEYYLKNDLYLPGDLDGWKVIDDIRK